MARHIEHEVQTAQEFAALSGLPTGAIVVTDVATGAVVHRPACSTINAETFAKKVVANAAKNGRYYCPASNFLAGRL